MKKIILITLIFLLSSNCMTQQKSEIPIYKNEKADLDIRIRDIILRMTLEEKIANLNICSRH